MNLQLHNPHSVLAALRRRPTSVLEVRINSDRPADAWRDVVDAARSQGARIVTGASRGADSRRGRRNRTERTGAASALIRRPEPIALKDLLDEIRSNSHENSQRNGLWLALDCLQDPQNVGAVFRSAAFFGVRGIALTKDRSAPINSTVCDVAAGGVEHVPFVLESNLARILDAARDAGAWVLGTSEHAESDVRTIERDRPWLVVIGNEQHGLRELTLKKCDVVCGLPALGNVPSLNVSAAAAAMLALLTKTESGTAGG